MLIQHERGQGMSDKSNNDDSSNKPLRNHKDTVFRMLFSEKEKKLKSYRIYYIQYTE